MSISGELTGLLFCMMEYETSRSQRRTTGGGGNYCAVTRIVVGTGSTVLYHKTGNIVGRTAQRTCALHLK